MEGFDWFWLVGGAAVTALIILALGYWISQETRALRAQRAPPPPPNA